MNFQNNEIPFLESSFFIIISSAFHNYRAIYIKYNIINWMWLFPMAHSIPWVHFEKYLSEPVFPIAGSYLYLGGICAALAVICLMAAGKYQAGKV